MSASVPSTALSTAPATVPVTVPASVPVTGPAFAPPSVSYRNSAGGPLSVATPSSTSVPRAHVPPIEIPSHKIPAGAGRVRIAAGPRGARVVQAYSQSPLKFLTPENHGKFAWVYAATFGGGLVDGDEVDIELGVEAGAGALLATQASTKVYRSPRGCRQSLRATVGDAGALVVLPDPVVCFAGARYEQTARIDLATTSSLLFADIFTAGRSARGERWQFETYASRVQVFVEGRPVFHDATTLDAKAGPLVHRMGRFDALATVYITGPAFLPLAAKVVATPSPWQRRGDLLEVISDAQGKGALLRVAGASVEGVLRTLRDRLKPLSDVLGDDPFARKW